MDKDDALYQSYSVTVQPSTSSWVVVLTPDGVINHDRGKSTREPKTNPDEEEIAENTCDSMDRAGREISTEQENIHDPLELQGTKVEETIVKHECEKVKEVVCEQELDEAKETICKHLEMNTSNCDKHDKGEVNEIICEQVGVEETIFVLEEMCVAHNTTVRADGMDRVLVENVPEVGVKPSSSIEYRTATGNEDRTEISDIHRPLSHTTEQKIPLEIGVDRTRHVNRRRGSKKRTPATGRSQFSVAKTQQESPKFEASSISPERCTRSSTETSDPKPETQDGLWVSKDHVTQYNNRATGKPCRNLEKHERIFNILITCADCGAAYCTRTRTGAPYTEYFLRTGVVIHCTKCGHFTSSSCCAVESGNIPQDASPPIIKCDDESGCKREFRSLGAYGQHKLRHSDDPVNCPVCRRTFKNKAKLASHSDAVHRDKSLDKVCDKCGKPFKNESELRRHQKAIHVPKTVIRCELCDKVVRSQYGLRVHMSVHRQKQYKCRVCDKIFRSRVGCNGHYKTHFADNRCIVCKKEFSTMDGLAKHSVVHKANRTTFRCTFCQKNYKSSLGYRKHMKNHENRFMVNS